MWLMLSNHHVICLFASLRDLRANNYAITVLMCYDVINHRKKRICAQTDVLATSLYCKNIYIFYLNMSVPQVR